MTGGAGQVRTGSVGRERVRLGLRADSLDGLQVGVACGWAGSVWLRELNGKGGSLTYLVSGRHGLDISLISHIFLIPFCLAYCLCLSLTFFSFLCTCSSIEFSMHLCIFFTGNRLKILRERRLP